MLNLWLYSVLIPWQNPAALTTFWEESSAALRQRPETISDPKGGGGVKMRYHISFATNKQNNSIVKTGYSNTLAPWPQVHAQGTKDAKPINPASLTRSERSCDCKVIWGSMIIGFIWGSMIVIWGSMIVRLFGMMSHRDEWKNDHLPRPTEAES